MNPIENKTTHVETSNAKEFTEIKEINPEEIASIKENTKNIEKNDPENLVNNKELTENMLAQIDAANNETIKTPYSWEEVAAVRTSAWAKWAKQAWNNLMEFFS